MVLKIIPVGPLEVNCILLADEEKGEAFIVDPGAEGDRIAKIAENFRILGILCTHGHIDHVGQVALLRERFGAPFYLHPADLPLKNDEIWGLSGAGGSSSGRGPPL